MISQIAVSDRLHRPLQSLRLSLTARCNLACPYCLPDHQELPGLLDQAQRLALITAACSLGVRRLRLTGGEPLLSSGLESLLAAVQSRRLEPADPLSNLLEVTLTSNGLLLSEDRAKALKLAGLDRITISLDGTDGISVAEMTGQQGGESSGAQILHRVLEAIRAARSAGFDPARGALKLNSVIQRGRNEQQVLPLASLARNEGLELRLIEYMDVGNRNGWTPEAVFTAEEMVRRIDAVWPLVHQGRSQASTARRWRYQDGAGWIAVVASISDPFCNGCNRLRLTADGMAYTCLFAEHGTSLRPWLVPEIDAEGLMCALADLWQARRDRYSEQRLSADGSQPSSDLTARQEMAYLGG
ncbi:MAG: GTP 3',8-cyclase MoaA [Prochlorococcus sp.]|nr:radical SAM protein [Prochlorococcus sp.]MDP6193381.1 radical SAM protein [Prochlorococcaceae cyanobacterium ETNP18_MAG_1]CAI8169638.1 MAG: GTP 3',8-cyclase [Prochlorococcus marinus str. MIT 9215]